MRVGSKKKDFPDSSTEKYGQQKVRPSCMDPKHFDTLVEYSEGMFWKSLFLQINGTQTIKAFICIQTMSMYIINTKINYQWKFKGMISLQRVCRL